MAHSLFARKPLALILEEMKGENRLRRILGPVQLTSLGIGAIIGAGTVLDAAVTFAERVRKHVEAHTFTFDGTSIRRTASFGVSAWPHPRIANSDVLVRAADDALYVAKETGRDKVVRFDSDEFNEHLAADDGSDRSRHAITTPRVADEGVRWQR